MPQLGCEVFWTHDRFQCYRADNIKYVTKHSNVILTEQNKMTLFTQIVQDKNKCKEFMNSTIYSALVKIAQRMNILVPIYLGSTQTRLCVTWKEVVQALQMEQNLDVRAVAVHFLMVYWRNDLYQEVLNTTHQMESEKAFLEMHNIIFLTGLDKKMGSQKSCVASMYQWCFNQIKIKANRALFSKQKMSVTVTAGSKKTDEFSRRPKHIFYVLYKATGQILQVRN